MANKNLRCSKCGKKLAEYNIMHGTISIQCTKKECRYVNTMKFSPINYESLVQKPKNAI